MNSILHNLDRCGDRAARTFAVIPAAGHSTRMGQPKLSLPLAGRTVLELVVAALRAGGVDHVLVVVGPHVSELAVLASAAGADVLLLNEPTPDMRTTVERGLERIKQLWRPREDDLWFLVPGDHPALNPIMIRQLLLFDAVDRSIVVPIHAGRRGHPTRFNWSHAVGIRSLPVGKGINAFVREHAAEVRELTVADDGILADLDTPEDYAKIAAKDFHYLLTNVFS